VSSVLARRAADRRPHRIAPGAIDRAARHAHPRDPTMSEHARGWIAYGMSRPLPSDASNEMRAGYSEHRNDIVSRVSASEGAVTVLS
jgi:hypothetical protein